MNIAIKWIGEYFDARIKEAGGEGGQMTAREQLELVGWVCVSYKRKGMVRIVQRHDPKTGEVHQQREAMRILRERKHRAKGER